MHFDVICFSFEQILSEGMLVLGCIREIQTTELIVSLANSLNGYIPITSINDQVNKQLKDSMTENIADEDASFLIPSVL